MDSTTPYPDPASLLELVPPATLEEARSFRDDLVLRLARERDSTSTFLLTLADFDRRRGWEPLGHSSLFAFLMRELGLSKGGASSRLKSARLVLRFPEVIEPLRDGRLCVTSLAEVARVLTPENMAEILPLFYDCSVREAREVAAAVAPFPRPPRREAVTSLPLVTPRSSAGLGSDEPSTPVQSTEPLPAGAAAPRTEVRPLTVELRRLHVTVSARFLDKVAAARDGLSNAHPDVTTEQVLEAALDLLLEKQARAKALVKKPRRRPADAGPAPDGTVNPRAIPAAVERAVRLRDGDRCAFPLDVGGVCGSTWRVQLDHVVPVALGGTPTIENLRCACRRHNRLAAERLLGDRATSAMRAAMARRRAARKRRRGRPAGQPPRRNAGARRMRRASRPPS